MPEIMPWHKTQLINPEYTRVDLVKEGANSKAHIKLFKSKGGTEMTPEEIIAKLTPEHQAVIQKALDDAKKKADDAEAAKKAAEDVIEKSKKPAPGTSEEEILKSVKDPAVKALLETQIAKAKAAETVAKQLKEEQETVEAIAKAKEVPNIGAEEATIADVYKKLKTADAELCDNVFGIFKAASALIAEGGALSEVGKSAGEANDTTGTDSEEAAWAKIDKKAEEIAKSRGIKHTAAVSQVIKEHPELYKAYLEAQQG